MDRGDIFSVDLDPTQGSEQRGRRPVLVVSRAEFNRLGIALVCPITQGGLSARSAGWTVALTGAGTETQGLVLCHQPRVLDLKARRARKVETAPDFVVDDVLAKLQAIID